MLVSYWRKWHKIATVRFWLLVGVLAQLAEQIPMVTRDMLSPTAANVISGIAAISIGLRLWKQADIADDTNSNGESDS